jgi:hypothetical protein
VLAAELLQQSFQVYLVQLADIAFPSAGAGKVNQLFHSVCVPALLHFLHNKAKGIRDNHRELLSRSMTLVNNKLNYTENNV